MRSSKYPLEVLERLRRRTAECAVRDLAVAVREHVSAEEHRAAAEIRRGQHAARVDAVRDSESAKLDRGELTAGDLARAAAWEARVASERAELLARKRSALEKETDAASAERDAGLTLVERKADLDVVLGEKARASRLESTREEARVEEGAVEAWRPKLA
jgi:hypothetical protein